MAARSSVQPRKVLLLDETCSYPRLNGPGFARPIPAARANAAAASTALSVTRGNGNASAALLPAAAQRSAPDPPAAASAPPPGNPIPVVDVAPTAPPAATGVGSLKRARQVGGGVGGEGGAKRLTTEERKERARERVSEMVLVRNLLHEEWDSDEPEPQPEIKTEPAPQRCLAPKEPKEPKLTPPPISSLLPVKPAAKRLTSVCPSLGFMDDMIGSIHQNRMAAAAPSKKSAHLQYVQTGHGRLYNSLFG